MFFVVFVVFFPYHGCARMVNRQSLNSPACSVSHYGSAHIAHAHPLDHMISTYRTCSSLRSATSRGNAHSVTVTHMANYRHTGPSDRRHITRNTKNIAPTQTSTLHWQVLPNIYRILHWHRLEHRTHIEGSSMSPHLSKPPCKKVFLDVTIFVVAHITHADRIDQSFMEHRQLHTDALLYAYCTTFNSVCLL